ncbi:MAG TPA: hypothetical protein VEK38_01345, partial [Candidatus Bathyarchaeia archaeon]|nr:hypothetical protein [Candidatus Bathyarchaeia archaeon]
SLLWGFSVKKFSIFVFIFLTHIICIQAMDTHLPSKRKRENFNFDPFPPLSKRQRTAILSHAFATQKEIDHCKNLLNTNNSLKNTHHTIFSKAIELEETICMTVLKFRKDEFNFFLENIKNLILKKKITQYCFPNTPCTSFEKIFPQFYNPPISAQDFDTDTGNIKKVCYVKTLSTLLTVNIAEYKKSIQEIIQDSERLVHEGLNQIRTFNPEITNEEIVQLIDNPVLKSIVTKHLNAPQLPHPSHNQFPAMPSSSFASFLPEKEKPVSASYIDLPHDENPLSPSSLSEEIPPLPPFTSFSNPCTPSTTYDSSPPSSPDFLSLMHKLLKDE